jgi:chromosome segregation ATPase
MPVCWQAVCVSSSPTGIQRTVRRLDEDVTVIVESLGRIEDTQDAHTVAIAELRSDVTQLQTGMTELRSDVTQLRSDVTQLQTDVTQLRSDVTQLRSDVTQLQTGMTELQSGMSEVLVLLRGGQVQK